MAGRERRICSTSSSKRTEANSPVFVDDPALTPIYTSWPGWSQDVSGILTRAELPEGARGYLDRLESALEVPIVLVSTGSDRDATIFARNPWA